jgi:transposase
MNPFKYAQMMKYLTRVKKQKPDLPDVFPASKAPIPPVRKDVETIEAINRFNRDNPRTKKADGGMLVQPGFGGTRQGYAKSKGSGIKLSAAQIKKLKENLSAEDFNKLDFDRTGLQSGQLNYGIGQREDNKLYKKVVNILKPGAQSTGVKILNDKKLSNALIKSANAGDDIKTIITKMNKIDKNLTRNQISSAINSLVKRGDISKEFGRVPGKDLSVGEQQAYNKIIEKEVKAGKLNLRQIAGKADVSISVVQDWIVDNKGQKFYDENYTYEKGRLKTGTLQKQKDLFNYIETVDNISAKEIKKIFKMGSGKETQKLMSDLVGQIYRMRGNTKSASLVVPYDDEGRMREVLRKIRNAPDFEDIYQRRIGDLVRDAYPPGPKRVQALKSLGEYWNFSRALKEVAPELALSLDHVVPFQFLEEVKQGANPVNLIKVKPIPQAINRFKANFDNARIELNRLNKIDPNNPEVRKKFKLLKELENITPIEFGGISQKGNVYDFKAKPIGQSNLIKDAARGIEQYQKLARFSQDVLENKTLQKKFKDAGVIAGKNLAMFDRVKLLSTEQIKGLAAFMKKQGIACRLSKGANCNTLQAYIKSLNDLSVRSSQGDTAAAAKLKNFTNKAATTGRFLKNALGPLAIASEFALEGGIALNKTLDEGIPFKQAFADSYINKYLFGPKLQIDKEAEIAKEMAKGEEFAMAERGRRMIIPQSAQADAQRLKQREEERLALFPDLQFANPSNQEIDQILKEQRVFSPFTLGFGMQQKQPGIGDTKYNKEQAYNEIRDLINKRVDESVRAQQLQNIATAGGIANLAGGGIAKMAGVSSGPPPESGPNSQGLQGLMKRVRNL